MILKLLFELVLSLLEIVFSWVSFPQMPTIVITYKDMLFDYIEQGLGFVWLFIPRGIVWILLPIVLVLENFDKLYKVIMWILRKIPFLNMS